jgi:hypothetical protein
VRFGFVERAEESLKHMEPEMTREIMLQEHKIVPTQEKLSSVAGEKRRDIEVHQCGVVDVFLDRGDKVKDQYFEVLKEKRLFVKPIRY